MIFYIKGGIQAKGIWKQDLEMNICVQEGWETGAQKAPRWGASPNVVRVIKSRRLGLESHVARMEEVRNALKMLAVILQEISLKEGLGVDGKTIL